MMHYRSIPCRSAYKSLRCRLSLLALLGLLGAGCASPREAKVEFGIPSPQDIGEFVHVYEATVTMRSSKPQYTLLEQLSSTAPTPKNGYALDLRLDVAKTVKGDPKRNLVLFISDPKTKHTNAPVAGRPNVAIGAKVYVALNPHGPIAFWVKE